MWRRSPGLEAAVARVAVVKSEWSVVSEEVWAA